MDGSCGDFILEVYKAFDQSFCYPLDSLQVFDGVLEKWPHQPVIKAYKYEPLALLAVVRTKAEGMNYAQVVFGKDKTCDDLDLYETSYN